MSTLTNSNTAANNSIYSQYVGRYFRILAAFAVVMFILAGCGTAKTTVSTPETTSAALSGSFGSSVSTATVSFGEIPERPFIP